MGRLLMEGGATLKAVDVKVLHPDNAERYFAQREGLGRYAFLLDMTHELQNELPHGLILSMVNARSGLKALSVVSGPLGAALFGRGRQHRAGAKSPTTQLGAGMWGWT